MEPIKIHSNKVIAILCLAAGLFCLVVTAQYGGAVGVFSGSISVLFGILLLTVPTIVITDEEIQMRNIYGMTLKRHKYNASNTEVKDRKVYVNGKKIRIGSGGLMNPPDVKKALDYFGRLNAIDKADLS